MTEFKIGDRISPKDQEGPGRSMATLVAHFERSDGSHGFWVQRTDDGNHFVIADGAMEYYEIAPLPDGYYLTAGDLYRLRDKEVEFWQWARNTGGWESTITEIRNLERPLYLGPIVEEDED